MKLIAYLALTGACEAMKVLASWPDNEKRVMKNCDGAFLRFHNEQSSQLYEKNSEGSKRYEDVSFPMDRSMMYWTESKNPEFDSSYVDLRAMWDRKITKS